MENSAKNSGSLEIPKRKRSLDLKSIYESRVLKVEKNKKRVADENDQGDVKKKKRKSRKEVALSCFASDAKKRKKEDVNGANRELDSRQKSNSGSKASHDISVALSDNGSAFNIPKRPRGSVGWKKRGNDPGIERLGLPDCVNSADRAGALKAVKTEDDGGPIDSFTPLATLSKDKNGGVSNSKSAAKAGASNSRSKKKADSKSTGNSSKSNLKLKLKGKAAETRNGRSDSGSLRHTVKEYNLVVNNGDTSSKKQRSNTRKKRDSVVCIDGGESPTKRSEPSVGTSISDSPSIDLLDDDDDDEENLEQNAARMLSSRFDPSCTGFSSKRKSSVSQMTDGFSFQDSFSRRANSLGGGESTSADDRNRALRPRREDNSKGLSRKRRHFYEILSSDLDAYWVINRRIKIFWPLDETWYYGFVRDYHSESKLHHIRYDDRDEEWVDLQEEKFKLLLLPTEVPGKLKSKKQSTGMGQTVPPDDDDSCIHNYLDSEPIASWLATSSQRVKSLSKSSKRQRTSQTYLPSVSSLPSDETDNSNRSIADSVRTRDKFDCESLSNDNLGISQKIDNALLENTSGSKNGKHLVYVRKKYHKKSEGDTSVLRDSKARASAPWTIPSLSSAGVGQLTMKEAKCTYDSVDSSTKQWSMDSTGRLRLDDLLVESKELRFQICLPVLPFLKSLFVGEDLWLLYDTMMLQHGVLMTTSSSVILEMLFIDTDVGLRFLLLEGFMNEALAFIFLILNALSQSDEHSNSGMKFPVTSMRFRLSSVQDLRKQHVFAFHSFSRLRSSKWLYLYSKVLKRCFLSKQLSVSECTYDNIKKLEHESSQQCKLHPGFLLSSKEGYNKDFFQGILPLGGPIETRSTRMMQSGFSLPGKPRRVPEFSFSFSAAPTFFFTLHLQLLMEQSFACVSLQHQAAPCSSEILENDGQSVADCAQFEASDSVSVQDVPANNEIGIIETEASACEVSPASEQDLRTDVPVSNVVEKVNSLGLSHDADTARCFKEFTEIAPRVIAQSRRPESQEEMHEQIVVAAPLSALTSITSPTANPRSESASGCLTVDVPSLDRVDAAFDRETHISRHNSDARWTLRDGFYHGSNPTGSKRSLQHGRTSNNSPLGHHSPVWRHGKPNFMSNGFSNGPKKPRTQVRYTLPFPGYELSAKQEMQNHRSLPCKRIRRASLKRISDGSRNNKKNLELLACVGNVLVTHGDKGWRECGAHIFLEVADHNEWSLTVKLSGVTKYSYKVKHILQPGSTNRYSHAMMWKGGKDWVLEFPDRSQWMLFKEMHEECYNRNIRAASVKNIPIPGVRLVDESDEYGTEVPFVRNSSKYYRQVQNDVDMAIDPSHILYDMDSDDEQWLMTKKDSDEHKCEEITEELLEKTMDIFEKVSYVRCRDNFTDAEIEELVTGLGSVEAAKAIYEHWQLKREKKGMPLIRHLQPPLWERYQHQLKEWERTVARGNYAFSVGSQEKVAPPEKPPMFAFCLRPRGLDVPNKGSKQRSHRKFPVSGHHHPSSGNHDGLLGFGRRSSVHAFGDEKVLYTNSVHYSSDVSPSLQASARLLSPRDAHFSLSTDVSDWNRYPKLYKNKPKDHGLYPSSHNQQMMSYNQRTIDNRHGVPQWNMNLPELSGQRHYFSGGPHRQKMDQLDSSDLDEFRLRDASSAAKHARNMAKLKRERAQRLLYRADLALQKAVVAIMNADAIKDSRESSKGDN